MYFQNLDVCWIPVGAKGFPRQFKSFFRIKAFKGEIFPSWQEVKQEDRFCETAWPLSVPIRLSYRFVNFRSPHRLHGGRGLEFPSVTQPVATSRTAAYHVGADVFACSFCHLQFHSFRHLYCIAYMVRHLGTSPTILLQPLTSLLGFVSVLRTDSNFSYLAVDLTRTAVGLSSLMVRRYGIRYLTNSETRRVVQTVLDSSSRQSCSVSTNVTSALEVS